MDNIFNSVRFKKPKRNVFDLSHDVKMSLDMGRLYPCCVIDTVPGDKFDLSGECVVRFAPMLAPVMQRYDVFIHYFFCPNRLLWPNWENFITNTKVGGAVPAHPFMNLTDTSDNNLMSYLGFPTMDNDPTHAVKISPLALAAYYKIYDEYYRDQNLCSEQFVPLVDGDNTPVSFDLMEPLLRAWEHDYFTSCLPFAQKGDAVNLPIKGFEDIPVRTANASSYTSVFTDDSGTHSSFVESHAPLVGSDVTDTELFAQTSVLEGSSTINDLRRAEKLQQWLERAARGGSRYVENILAHFGVKSSDARLNRPEYIVGAKQPVSVSEVLSTAVSGFVPQGQMSGHAVSVASGRVGSYYCEEHGFIMGIMSVMPKSAYQQGTPRKFLKFDNFDYFWPSFAHLGEQEVWNKEIFSNQGVTEQDSVFGYLPRYAEYKFENSRIAGDFRNGLSYWHSGRIFGTPPVLNQEFIECKPDDRIFAVTGTGVDNLYAHVFNSIKANRLMPKFGTPML